MGLTCWAVSDIVLLPKASESLDLLTEAAPLERFACLRRDLAALYAGYYVAELLTDLTDLHDPHPKLFDAARITLRHLGEPDLRPRRISEFELACLRELGLMPALDECAHCGGHVDTAGEVAFGLATGGVLCPACRPGQPHVTMLSSTTLEAIRDPRQPRERPGASFRFGARGPGLACMPDRRGGHQSCPGPSPETLALPGSVNRWTWFPGIVGREPRPEAVHDQSTCCAVRTTLLRLCRTRCARRALARAPGACSLAGCQSFSVPLAQWRRPTITACSRSQPEGRDAIIRLREGRAAANPLRSAG